MTRVKKLIAAVMIVLAICSFGMVQAHADESDSTDAVKTYYCIANYPVGVRLSTSPNGRALAWITMTESEAADAYVYGKIDYSEDKDELKIRGLTAQSMRLYCEKLAIGSEPCKIDKIISCGGSIMTLEVKSGSYLKCNEVVGAHRFDIAPSGQDNNVYKPSALNLSEDSAEVIISDDKPYVYTGKVIAPTVQVKYEGRVIEQGTDYKVTYKDNINAGTQAKIVVTGCGDYGGEIQKEFTIKPANVQSASIDVASCVYDGTAKLPKVTVKLNGAVMGTDNYKITLKNNVSAGNKAEAAIEGCKNLTGKVSKTFTISQADITKATVTLAANSYTYSGSYFKPAVTVAYGSAKLKASDYTVQYANNKEPGTATVTVTANGSNCVSGKRVVKNFRIEKKVPVISFKSPISTTWHNANGTHGFECVAPSDCQGTFSFKSSNPKLLAINAAGGRVQVMNNKAFGSVVITATFTPKGADAAHYSTKSITRTIKVVPNIVKIANKESKKSGQLYIQWSNSKKEYNASEYRIYYYGYKKDSEECGQMSLYNSKSKITGTSTTITGLKAGKYYIKVVPCYKSGGNVHNGASTSAVKCVIK